MEKYEPPALQVLGSVRELTLATRNGDRLDDTFPSGTPISQITVS